MALTIPAWCGDQIYPAWFRRKQLASLVTAGVVNPSTDFIVSPSSGLQVQASAGAAYVEQTVCTEGGGNSFYNGLYEVFNDGAANPSNSIAVPISNPRIDQIILQVLDIQEQGVGGSSKAQLLWLEGSESASASLGTMGPGLSNPGAATLPANSLLLDYVLQTVGESSISPSNIVPAVSASVSLTGAPVGQISHTAGASDEAGADGVVRWMICNGRAISRTTYLALFKKIGTTFGSGDGSTTFNIPDGRGLTLVGADPTGVHLPVNTPALGATLGEEEHTLTTGQIPLHDHPLAGYVPYSSATWSGFDGGGGGETAAPNSTGFAGGQDVNSTENQSSGGGTHNNVQPSLAVNHLIKVL
jgi:microcystin-dependent protein